MLPLAPAYKPAGTSSPRPGGLQWWRGLLPGWGLFTTLWFKPMPIPHGPRTCSSPAVQASPSRGLLGPSRTPGARCAVWVAQEPWVRRSWLRPGVTGGLVRAPRPPTLSAVRAPSGFPPGPNEYVPLASLCVHCESGETEAYPNPLSLGM